MDKRVKNINDSRKTVIYSVSSGTLLGLAAFFIKIAATGSGFSAIISNPITWLAAILGLAGFLLLQESLYTGFISKAVPLMAGISIVLPVLLAFAFLNEPMEGKLIAIILIAAGIFILTFLSKK